MPQTPNNQNNKNRESNVAKTTDSRYLERLEFNPELRKSWLNFFVSNFRVVILLVLLISLAGIYSYFNLPRESNPEVKIPIAVVSTVYPGVSPSDIEELITKKIETAVSGLSGVKRITSNSANSFSSVVVEFEADEDLTDSIRRLRDRITSAERELPADASLPQVLEISFDDTPIWTVALTGPYDGFTMREYADKLKDELEKIPGVREINVSGGDEREFEIAYDPGKLIFYGISPSLGNEAVRSANLAIPAGNFEGTKFVYPVRSDGRFFDESSLGRIPVSYGNGSFVFLKDIASVKEKAVKKSVYSRLSTEGSVPAEAVTIDLVKRTGGSILETVDSAEETVGRMVKTFPSGITYTTTTDFAERINEDFTALNRDFLITLALVFGTLFLIVGLKEAFVAGLAIPLVFFTTFAVMLLSGISLNFLSVFSLILSLGLLVDDAIVVVSATKQYLRTGKYTPEEAVLLVLNDFKVVLTTTTLTTVWAFIPLLFTSGIIGEFIKSIPITVSVTLISSLLIALMVNHPLAAVLERVRPTRNLFYLAEGILIALAGLFAYFGGIWNYFLAVLCIGGLFFLLRWYERNNKAGKEALIANEAKTEREWQDPNLIKKKLREQGDHEGGSFWNRLLHGIIHFDRFLPPYEKYLRKLADTRKARVRTLLAVLAIFIFSAALPVLGIVKTEFFPPANEDQIYISIEAPIGYRLSETDKIVRETEEKLMKYPEIRHFSTLVGRQGPSPSGAGSGSGQNSSNLASIVVTVIPKSERDFKSYDFASVLRAGMREIKEGIVTVESIQGGPPSGSAFEARIKGEDLNTLDKIAHDLLPILSGISGVVAPDISLKDTAPEYTFMLRPERLVENALSSAYLGGALRMAISGTEVTTVLRENKEIDVNARFAPDKIPTLESLQNLQIVNLRGEPVFLKDVADITLQPSVNSITRIDQKRTVLLSAGVEGDARPNQVLAEFEKKMAESYKLPEGYEIVYGGENEQNTESVISILRAMIIAGLLIISTLVVQFNSFKKALIVLVAVPLALVGVFVGLAIFRVNLSFPGLIGILALFGIVVKNSIILVDKINLNLKFGIPFYESVIDAGKSRLEAIFITSICTIFGLIPVTLSNETWTALGTAVIFGLMLSSFLTLFVVPVLFVTFIGERERF